MPGDQFSLRNSFLLLYVAASIHTRCVIPILRDRFGAEANGLLGLLALVGMLFYGGLMKDNRMLAYVGFWFIALVGHRLESLHLRHRRGFVIHSRYAGRPVMALAIARFIKDEGSAKLFIEPLICLAYTWPLNDWSPAAAKLVGSAGVSIVIVELIDRQIRRQREQAVIDARLEMEDLADRVRSRVGY
jgi:hypothetical protein